MGKSKKKKNQYKDFQKVKLKVGKKLPKGLNETVATFKSRSIQVKEQLKADRTEDEPTTRRKLSLPDLLSQCQHYNTTVKHDALTGIKELLTGHPELTHRNLALVLERCSELFMDKDPVVRQTVQKVLRLIFTQVSSSHIAPFFPSLSAHLCCAMTHISDDIQQDSLAILDLCLENFPELVTASSNKIMPNFIEQISRQTQSSKGNTQGRSLLVNPSSRLSSQKWRNRVLGRLQMFFRALLDQKVGRSQDTGHIVVKIHHFEVAKTNDVQPFGASAQCSEEWIRLKHCSQRNDEESQVGLKNFAEILVPLLLQCWIEAGPSQLVTDLPGNCLGVEAMNTLWNVVNILQLLLEVMDKQVDNSASVTWFKERYFKEMLQYFLPYFPYAMHEKPRKAKAGEGSKVKGQKEMLPQISVFTLNLSVCKVFSYFMKDSSGVEVWQGKILEYLCEGLPGCRLTEEQLGLTVAIVEKMLQCTGDNETVDSLLSVTFDIFKRCTDVTSKEAKLLLSFFGDFTFGGHRASLAARNDVIKQWMASLPSLMWLLIETCTNTIDTDVATNLLHYLKSAGPLGEETFSSNLKKLLFDHVFAINNDKLDSLPKDLQKRLVELLYWVPVTQIDRTMYQQIAQFCRNPCVSRAVISHVIDLVAMKIQPATTVGDDDTALSEFLSFMLSLIVGEKSKCTNRQSNFSYWNPEICSDQQEEVTYNHKIYLLKIVSESIRQCQQGSELAEVVMEFVNSYLGDDSNHTLNLLTAIGLLHLLAMLPEEPIEYTRNSSVIQNNLDPVVSHLFGAVLNHLVSLETVLVPVTDVSPAQCGKSGVLNREAMDLDSIESGALKQIASAVTDHTLQTGKDKGVIETMSAGIKEALWDILFAVLVNLHGLLPLYISDVKQRICHGNIEGRILQLDICGMLRLLQSKSVKKMAKTHKPWLQTMVTDVESSAFKLKDKHWHQLKYEISLL